MAPLRPSTGCRLILDKGRTASSPRNLSPWPLPNECRAGVIEGAVPAQPVTYRLRVAIPSPGRSLNRPGTWNSPSTGEGLDFERRGRRRQGSGNFEKHYRRMEKRNSPIPPNVAIDETMSRNDRGSARRTPPAIAVMAGTLNCIVDALVAVISRTTVYQMM